MVAKTKKVTMGIKASKNYASDCEASRIVSIGPLKSNEMAANNFAAAVQNKSFKIRSYPKKSR